jgi:aquaporin Z
LRVKLTKYNEKLLAEFINFGLFWARKAVLAGIPEVGIGLLGFTCIRNSINNCLFMVIFQVHIFNPVSIGLWIGGRFNTKELMPYIISQILGAIAAAGVLYIIATGNGSAIGGFAANGYGDHSPGHYNMISALVCEVVMTFMFILIILGATDERAPKGFAGIAIGLGLTLVHLISIPVTNTSVNPARSISQALFVGGWALEQLWMFIAARSQVRYLPGLLTK